jgi:hypothetical protein
MSRVAIRQSRRKFRIRREPDERQRPTTPLHGTRDVAEAYAARLRNGAGGGIGFQLGELNDGTFVAGIDLDSCTQCGELAPWASAILGALPSYAERSPSGHGIKIFFCVDRQAVRPFLDQIGIPTHQWGTRRGIPGKDDREHGPAIEIYFNHRYFAVTGEAWPNIPPELLMLDEARLDHLATLIPTQRSPEAPNHDAADNSRSARAFRRGLEMGRAGASFQDFCEALRTDPETAAWYTEKGSLNGWRELHRIWEKARGTSSKGEIKRLAALPQIEYDRERKSAASRLDCLVSTLDKAVKAERSGN